MVVLDLQNLLKAILDIRVYEFLAHIKYLFLSKNYARRANKPPISIIQYEFRKAFGRELNISSPVSFNEKQNWMKLFWYDERAPICCNKFFVRQFVLSKGLGFILNELYAVYDSHEDIDGKGLTFPCVIKTTHDSGGHMIICKSYEESDWILIRKKIRRWNSIDYCFASGEWPYHTTQKKIICEKYLKSLDCTMPIDFKFFCFNGKPEFIMVPSKVEHSLKDSERRDFYDLSWNKLPIEWAHPTSMLNIPKPICLDDMIQYSSILSEGFPFVRVDFYNVGSIVIFGEMTFFHGGGLSNFVPESIDISLGNKINLPEKDNPWEKHVHR